MRPWARARPARSRAVLCCRARAACSRPSACSIGLPRLWRRALATPPRRRRCRHGRLAAALDGLPAARACRWRRARPRVSLSRPLAPPVFAPGASQHPLGAQLREMRQELSALKRSRGASGPAGARSAPPRAEARLPPPGPIPTADWVGRRGAAHASTSAGTAPRPAPPSEEEQAAARLQATLRGRRVRERAAVAQRWRHAAAHVQAAWRGHAARAAVAARQTSSLRVRTRLLATERRLDELSAHLERERALRELQDEALGLMWAQLQALAQPPPSRPQATPSPPRGTAPPQQPQPEPQQPQRGAMLQEPGAAAEDKAASDGGGSDSNGGAGDAADHALPLPESSGQ